MSDRQSVEDITKGVLDHITAFALVGGDGWHYVRVGIDGSVYSGIEASPCCSEDEYYGREPHPVTVWEAGHIDPPCAQEIFGMRNDEYERYQRETPEDEQRDDLRSAIAEGVYDQRYDEIEQAIKRIPWLVEES